MTFYEALKMLKAGKKVKSVGGNIFFMANDVLYMQKRNRLGDDIPWPAVNSITFFSDGWEIVE